MLGTIRTTPVPTIELDLAHVPAKVHTDRNTPTSRDFMEGYHKCTAPPEWQIAASNLVIQEKGVGLVLEAATRAVVAQVLHTHHSLVEKSRHQTCSKIGGVCQMKDRQNTAHTTAVVWMKRKICREKMSADEITAKNLSQGKAFCVDLRHSVHRVPKEHHQVSVILGGYGEEEE